jgi:hypothetical protein
MRFPNAQGYTGVRALGRGPEAAVQQPNEIVKLAEVPQERGPDCYGGLGHVGGPLPVDVAKMCMLFKCLIQPSQMV